MFELPCETAKREKKFKERIICGAIGDDEVEFIRLQLDINPTLMLDEIHQLLP